MDKIRTYAWILLALSGVVWAKNVISVEAFDEQGGNPGQMTLRLRVENGGTDTVEGVRLRYFLKHEESRTLVVSPYYTAGAVLSLDTLENYLALNIDVPKLSPGVFPNASGISIGLIYADYGDLGKAGDFSYPGVGGFTETDKIPVYVGGAFYAGVTPVGDEIPKIRFVGIQPENFGTRSAWLELENFGTAAVNLGGFYLKWSASDSVEVGNAVLSAGERLRICGTGDSLECPTADVVLRKEGMALGVEKEIYLTKAFGNVDSLTLGNCNQFQRNCLQTIVDEAMVGVQNVYWKGKFFRYVDEAGWNIYSASEINKTENALPNAVPYVLPDSVTVVVDSNQKVRLSWIPVKGATFYEVAIFNKKDKSLVIRERVYDNSFVELDLKPGAYLWGVSSNLNGVRIYSVESEDEGLNLIYVFDLNELDSFWDDKKIVGVTPLAARKDTKLLDPVWGDSATKRGWNKDHLDHKNYDDEESWRCWAVGANMLNNYYGGTTTQDEIKIHGMKFLGRSPLFYFAHSSYGGASDAVIEDVFHYLFGTVPEKQMGMPSLDVLRKELNKEVANPAFVSVQFKSSRHVMVVDGYATLGRDVILGDNTVVAKKGETFFHFLNWDNNGGAYWIPASSFDYAYYIIAEERLHVGITDYRIHQDSDGDGVYDYDEIERFYSNPYDVDSDGDGIADFDEIKAFVDRCELKDAVGCRSFAFYDSDKDGLPTYLDVDSDNGGTWDGDELKDGTAPFDASDDTYQSSPVVVMTEWDAPADITLYSMDAMRVNDRTVCYDGGGYCKIASESGRVDFAVNVGVQSVVGDIYSRGGVWLRSLAQVNGDIHIYSKPVNDLSVNMQGGVAFGGTENVLNFADWPYSVYDKGKVYSIDGIDGAASLTVQNGEEKTLGDGDVYSAVKVEFGGTLKIAPGEMRVGNFQLESGSSIEFTHPGMKTVIWVGGKVQWRTSLANEDKELVARGFKLVQLSDADLFVEGDFAGTIHAVRAKLVMGQTVKRIYGRFVANTLTIHQNSQVHRVDFDPIVPTFEVVLR